MVQLATHFKWNNLRKTLSAHPKFLPGFCCGLEIEVENVRHDYEDALNFWTHRGDGSLRNAGVEFCSIPVEGGKIVEAINEFYNVIYKDYFSFSQRTSIHVHMNVRDFSYEQLASFLLVYCIFEKALFDFCGGDRDKNIFCVPLTDTQYPLRIIEKIAQENPNYINAWEKYSALNLSRLHDLGTVEFRHMPGIADESKLLQWLEIIQALRTFVIANPLNKILEMCDGILVERLVSLVFPNDLQRVFYQKPILKLCNKGFNLFKITLAMMDVGERIGTNISTDSPYNRYVRGV